MDFNLFKVFAPYTSWQLLNVYSNDCKMLMNKVSKYVLILVNNEGSRLSLHY